MDSSPQNNTQGSGGPRNQPSTPRISLRTWLIILAAFIIFDLFFYIPQMSSLGGKKASPQTTLHYDTFVAQVDKNNIATAHIQGDTADGNFRHPYRDAHGSYGRYTTTIFPELYSTVVSDLRRHHAQITLATTSTPAWVTILNSVFTFLPFLLLLAFFYFGARAARQQQQGVFGFGRSRAKLYTEESPRTTFADVAGVEAAKEELKEIVDFLTEPVKYHRLGARIPRGVLLVGPPGTGKTLLARAVAGEAHVPFFSISSSEFVELFVGVGASRVRDLFDRAKAVAPSIVFVDEIDAIGGRRSSGQLPSGGNDEREQTLNQLLTSMDGFEPNESVIVIAATNRPDILDAALLRPGRFDRQVTLDPPDRRGRVAILKIHTRQIPLGPDVDLDAVAQATPGMTGADLANLANEAALDAARKGESAVTARDFDEALDRITLGTATSPLMNEEERRITAYHEGGHTLVALILPNVDPVHRVTIIPRGRSLGVTQFRPVDDRRNYKRDFLLNRMAVGMGGRAAEEVAIGEITSGAQNDLQQVTSVARTMVTQLGMADELGPAYFGGPDGGGLNGNPYNPFETREYSEATATRIDEAVERLVNEAHHRAVSVLGDYRAALDEIATTLMREESLDRDQLTAIVNAHLPDGRPPIPTPTGPPTPLVDTPIPAPPAG